MRGSTQSAATADAVAILHDAMDCLPDTDTPTPAYVWLVDAAQHLRGNTPKRPELAGSVLYPFAR